MSLAASLGQIQKVLGVELVESPDGYAYVNVQGICTDTRSLQSGELFLALRGETFDGHDFIAQAVERGAGGLIVEKDFGSDVVGEAPVFVVKNTLVAYQVIAHWWRQQFDMPLVAVTGSVGKTTTKELLATVLGQQGNVLKTHANFNNEIGVPKTLLELKADHDFAVVEMAMRGPGEIALLSQIAAPTIGVITNVGTAHIGRLGSQAAIAAAKCELLAQMPTTSVAVLNGDNALLRETAATVWQGETLTYGLEQGDVLGQWLDDQTLKVGHETFDVPLPGRHNASNFLAALTVAKVLGIDWGTLKSGLTVTLPQGRSRQLTLPHDVTVLDETYNAGMESMLAALQLLKTIPGQRHLAVLGTMKELGDHAEELHYRVGEVVRALHLDILLVLADEPVAEVIAAGASGIASYCFQSQETLLQQLAGIVQPGDRILFKASHSVGLNQVVKRFVEARSEVANS